MNQGQTAAQVDFLSQGSGYTLFLTPAETVLSLQKPAPAAGDGAAAPDSVVLSLRFVGANPQPQVVGLDRLAGTSNYFIGSDPSQWHTNIANYGQVEYQNLYPGVDLVFYGNQRQLEYDYVVAPGTDPGVIKLAIDGAESMTIDGQGNLVLHTSAGDVLEDAPVVYQESGGVRQPVSGQFVLEGDGQVGFALGAYDHTRPLVIDPVLSYSTYLGGTGNDAGFGIAVDTAGDAYVTGYTSSTDFPTSAGAFQTTYGGGDLDAFVTKLNPTGTALVYSTYLGGTDDEEGQGIAVDTAGNAYVTGYTYSTNFPTTAGAFQTTYGGSQDVFVTKLNATGTALVYSTYLGGTDDEEGQGIAVDTAGNAYVTGYTYSTNFPTTAGAFQTTFGGGADVFVTKFAFEVQTTTALTTSASPSTYGDSVTFTATISDTASGVPTGSVEFYDGTTDLGPGSILSGSGNSATSTFTTSTLAAGVHSSISAVYTPTGSFVGSSGSLSQTVNPAPLTVTATGESMTYGGAVPALTYTYTGLVNGDTSATFSGGLATTATSSSSVGSYPITQGSLAATGNYTIGTFNAGTLTVTMATNGLIIALDPSVSGALSLSGNASINVSGVVYVDSSSSSALSAAGNAQVKAGAIDVHGKVQKSANASFSPAPVTGVPILANPLASLALPSTSGLTNYGSESLSGNSSATIQPGIYKQITVSGNAKLTLSSGTYIIEGGGLSVSENASVGGSGVMIVNAGSKYPTTGGTYGSIALGGNGPYNLSSLSTGAYAGIVIFQPGDNANALSVSSNASGMTGAIYAPAAQLAESGNGQLNAALVVDTLTVGGNGVVNSLPPVALSSVVGSTATTQDLNIADPPAGTDPQPARPHPPVIPPAVIPSPSSSSSGLMALDLALADGSTTEGWFRGIRDGFRFSRASRS